MVHPDKVGIEAKNKEDENFKFRSFLKGHADEEELEVVIDFEGVQWMGQGFAHMYNHVITS